ncbi:MAG TPA: hypothetical protein VGT05_00475 [Patescibacteria group bacterium]|nr:hypothetical protein [Patescibacteria group bacterium]
MEVDAHDFTPLYFGQDLPVSLQLQTKSVAKALGDVWNAHVTPAIQDISLDSASPERRGHVATLQYTDEFMQTLTSNPLMFHVVSDEKEDGYQHLRFEAENHYLTRKKDIDGLSILWLVADHVTFILLFPELATNGGTFVEFLRGNHAISLVKDESIEGSPEAFGHTFQPYETESEKMYRYNFPDIPVASFDRLYERLELLHNGLWSYTRRWREQNQAAQVYVQPDNLRDVGRRERHNTGTRRYKRFRYI